MRTLLRQLSPFKGDEASKRRRSEEPSGNKPKSVRQALLIERAAKSPTVKNLDFDINFDAMAMEVVEAASAAAAGAAVGGGDVFFDAHQEDPGVEFITDEVEEAREAGSSFGSDADAGDSFYDTDEEADEADERYNRWIARLLDLGAWSQQNKQTWDAQERERFALSVDSLACVPFFSCRCGVTSANDGHSCAHRSGALPAHTRQARQDTMDHVEADRGYFFAAMLRYSMDAELNIYYYVLGTVVCQAFFCEYYATNRQTMSKSRVC